MLLGADGDAECRLRGCREEGEEELWRVREQRGIALASVASVGAATILFWRSLLSHRVDDVFLGKFILLEVNS